uniref:Uncharacterized protein n=1 Tax=Lygus hesperus TaxID=30085 RepID=A0A0A9YWB5_LYGHE
MYCPTVSTTVCRCLFVTYCYLAPPTRVLFYLSPIHSADPVVVLPSESIQLCMSAPATVATLQLCTPPRPSISTSPTTPPPTVATLVSFLLLPSSILLLFPLLYSSISPPLSPSHSTAVSSSLDPTTQSTSPLQLLYYFFLYSSTFAPILGTMFPSTLEIVPYPRRSSRCTSPARAPIATTPTLCKPHLLPACASTTTNLCNTAGCTTPLPPSFDSNPTPHLLPTTQHFFVVATTTIAQSRIPLYFASICTMAPSTHSSHVHLGPVSLLVGTSLSKTASPAILPTFFFPPVSTTPPASIGENLRTCPTTIGASSLFLSPPSHHSCRQSSPTHSLLPLPVLYYSSPLPHTSHCLLSILPTSIQPSHRTVSTLHSTSLAPSTGQFVLRTTAPIAHCAATSPVSVSYLLYFLESSVLWSSDYSSAPDPDATNPTTTATTFATHPCICFRCAVSLSSLCTPTACTTTPPTLHPYFLFCTTTLPPYFLSLYLPRTPIYFHLLHPRTRRPAPTRFYRCTALLHPHSILVSVSFATYFATTPSILLAYPVPLVDTRIAAVVFQIYRSRGRFLCMCPMEFSISTSQLPHSLSTLHHLLPPSYRSV